VPAADSGVAGRLAQSPGKREPAPESATATDIAVTVAINDTVALTVAVAIALNDAVPYTEPEHKHEYNHSH